MMHGVRQSHLVTGHRQSSATLTALSSVTLRISCALITSHHPHARLIPISAPLPVLARTLGMTTDDDYAIVLAIANRKPLRDIARAYA
jgi:hypothetical protein